MSSRCSRIGSLTARPHARSAACPPRVRRAGTPRHGSAAPSALVLLWLLSADLPDCARAGNLHERTVRSSHEPGGRIRLTEVPHCAVIHEVRAAIRTELQVCRAVDPLDSIIREGLVARVVEGKLRLLDL